MGRGSPFVLDRPGGLITVPSSLAPGGGGGGRESPGSAGGAASASAGGGGCVGRRALPGRKDERQRGLAGGRAGRAYALGVGWWRKAIAASRESPSPAWSLGGDSEGKASRKSAIASSRASHAIWLGVAARPRLAKLVHPRPVTAAQGVRVAVQAGKQRPARPQPLVQGRILLLQEFEDDRLVAHGGFPP